LDGSWLVLDKDWSKVVGVVVVVVVAVENALGAVLLTNNAVVVANELLRMGRDTRMPVSEISHRVDTILCFSSVSIISLLRVKKYNRGTDINNGITTRE
jgi:hypothetical protein